MLRFDSEGRLQARYRLVLPPAPGSAGGDMSRLLLTHIAVIDGTLFVASGVEPRCAKYKIPAVGALPANIKSSLQ